MNWISLKDKKPSKLGFYLVSTSEGIGIAHWLYDGYFRPIEENKYHLLQVVGDDDFLYDIPTRHITHWMELPVKKATYRVDVEKEKI